MGTWRYFVSFTPDGRHGNFDVVRSSRIRSIEDVRAIEQILRDKGVFDPTVTDWKLLRRRWFARMPADAKRYKLGRPAATRAA